MTREIQPELPVEIRQGLALTALLFLCCFFALHLFCYAGELAAKLSFLPLCLVVIWFSLNKFKITVSLGYLLIFWCATEWLFSYGSFGLGLPLLLLLIIWDLKLWSREACYKVSTLEAAIFLLVFLFLINLLWTNFALFKLLDNKPFEEIKIFVYKSFSIFLWPLSLLLFHGFFLRRRFNANAAGFKLSLIPLILLFICASLVRQHEYLYAFAGNPHFALHPEFSASIFFIFISLTIFTIYNLIFQRQNKLTSFLVLAGLSFSYYLFPENYILSADWEYSGFTEVWNKLRTYDTIFGLNYNWKLLFKQSEEYTAGQYPLSFIELTFFESGFLALIGLTAVLVFSKNFIILPLAIVAFYMPILRDPFSLMILSYVLTKSSNIDLYQPKQIIFSKSDKVFVIAIFVSITTFAALLGYQALEAYRKIKAGPRAIDCDTNFRLNKNFKEILLTSEDILFYKHHGYDFARLKHTLLETIKYEEFVKGGSTISMQLAKLRYLEFEKSLTRKIQQLIITAYIEQRGEKEEILKEYLAKLGFAPDTIGIVGAAQKLYGKKPEDLTFDQSLSLIMSIPDPFAYNPTMAPDLRHLKLAAALKNRIKEFRKFYRADLKQNEEREF